MASEDVSTVSRAHDPERSVTVNGRYRVVGPGVERGEAVLYPAENLTTQQPATLVVLGAEAAADPEFVAAFRDQAQRLAKPVCRHRALVKVYATGTTDEGEPFVALEPLAGRSLREVLDERGTLPASEAVRLAIEVGQGLETLHWSGIVHGELRPESILVVKDETGAEGVKLVGVELTAARRTPAGLPIRDKTVGAYLAPEQSAHERTTEASDVHALGVLVVEMVTGQRPDGSGRGALPEIPAAIARIAAKAIAPEPGRRYASLSVMLNELWSVENEPSKPSARSGPADGVTGRRSAGARRARADVGMATALVVGLLLVGVTAWVARSERFRPSAPSEAPEPVVAAVPAQQAVTPPAAPVAEPPPTAIESSPTVSPGAPAVPVASETPPAPVVETPAVRPALPPAVEAAKPATVGSAVRAPRAVARQAERPTTTAAPTADGGDGAAIIDWLLKGGRSGG